MEGRTKEDSGFYLVSFFFANRLFQINKTYIIIIRIIIMMIIKLSYET